MTDNLRELRNALGRFATGVAVVTTQTGEGSLIGVTVNSFNALSLDPPLISWSLGSRARSLACFRTARHFAVNVLAAEQEELSVRFASPVADRFAGVAWTVGIAGLPLLKGCLASFECSSRSEIEVGDHWLFLGKVERFTYRAGVPLLFFASRYGITNRRLVHDLDKTPLCRVRRT